MPGVGLAFVDGQGMPNTYLPDDFCTLLALENS